MSEVWTHGKWTVTPGRERDFVSLWEELGDWTVKAFPRARGTLLRDTERPNVFLSFGPWPDSETAAAGEAQRSSREHTAAIRETLELFEPVLLVHVATSPDLPASSLDDRVWEPGIGTVACARK